MSDETVEQGVEMKKGDNVEVRNQEADKVRG